MAVISSIFPVIAGQLYPEGGSEWRIWQHLGVAGNLLPDTVQDSAAQELPIEGPVSDCPAERLTMGASRSEFRQID